MPSCPTCDKVYIRQSACQKHIIVCKFIPPSSATKNEADNRPTYAEMCFIVQTLTLEIVAMKQEMAIFRTIINTKKKKIGVFEWLNTNVAPQMHYIDWVKTIKVKKSHIQYLFTNNIVDTVVSIITSSITPATPIPFYAFGKTQTFYTFTQTWVVAEIIAFTRLFKHVETELWKLLNEWKMQNSAEIYNNAAMNEKYQKTVAKLTDISYTPNDVYNKMKTKIYNAIKMDIKSIMEDEIEFSS